MERRESVPRPGWQARVEKLGLTFHTPGVPYWDESAFYAFTAAEVDGLDRATAELHARCLDAVQHVIDARRWDDLRIPADAIALVERSWEEELPSIYGRFDLAVDPGGTPKLLEYNADTPTSLLEAAVVQWQWLKEVAPAKDQFNSIHERLIAGWKDLKDYLPPGPLQFASMDAAEDVLTASYLQDTAAQAGIETRFLQVKDIGWDAGAARFVDLAGQPIGACFKLYPWEWLVREEFASALDAPGASTVWIEPAWKMVLSNKGILPILWELFPGHPNLLEAHFQPGRLHSYAQKPLLSREGANVTLVREGIAFAQSADGGYGGHGFIEQALVEARPDFGGRFPVLGSWVIQGEPAGIGIRESDGPITGNLSRFVPHLFEPG
jgi:glutathionylspermidine synthase